MRGDDVAQLLFGDCLATYRRVASEEAYDGVRRLRQKPDDRPRQRSESLDETADQPRRALGSLQGEPFRRELADDECGVGDDEEDADETDGCGSPVREAGLAQAVGRRLRERHLTER